MTAAMIIKDTFPIKGFTSITQIGLKALNLATTYKTEIDPRLPGTMDSLTQDLQSLGVVLPGAVQARHEARAATAAQDTLARQGYARVRAIRQTVRASSAPKDVQRAYGIGQHTDPTQVRHVVAALQQVVDRAQSAPKEAAAFGITAADVASLGGFIAQLTAADMTQEDKRASAPLTTKERNLTANRILKTAALIAGTGMRAFADSPLEHESFKALMASTKKPSLPKPNKNSVPPAAPETPMASPVA